MAPGPSGTVFVSIPKQDGSVLVLLDRSGQPRPGWPITVEKSTACGLLLPADDGSVRVQCDGTDIPQPENDSGDGRAFAFSGDGRQLAGWPVQLRPGHAGSVVGDSLTVLAERYLTDLVTTGEVSHVAWVTAIAANGSLRNGTEVPLVEACCGEAWALGPGWVAYGVLPVGDGSSEPTEMSQITALDLSGVRAGWPVQFEGVGSATAFLPGERIVMTVGSAVQETSRVVAFDSDGGSGADVSAELPIATADWGVLCGAGSPMAPIIGPDGTVFVFSEIDTAIYALDPSLEVLRGWPYRPASRLVQRTTSVQQPGTVDVDCGRIGVPAGAPDGTLYLPLAPRDPTKGGSIVAVGRDGEGRPGWPVELRRPGSEFWSVVAGPDGTVYALTIEPEPGGKSSASIVAMAPDSTVLYTTTIVDP